MANVYIESKTASSVVLVLDNLDDAWSNGTRTVIWYIAKGYIPTSTDFDYWSPGEDIENYAPAGGTGTFSELEADTQYYVLCEVYYGSTLVGEFEGEFVTDSEYEKPTVYIKPWSWYSSNGSASDIETFNAYATTTADAHTIVFDHKVWNDMVDKAHEIVLAVPGMWGWDETYASLNDTKFHSEPYILTADMFNSLRNNIEIAGSLLNLGYDTGIGRVYSYDRDYPVKAEYFRIIPDYINACIDRLN